MAYQPISGIEAAEGGAGSGVLPAGAYVAGNAGASAKIFKALGL